MKDLKGLSILLYLEHRNIQFSSNPFAKNTIDKMAAEKCDYSIIPITNPWTYGVGFSIEHILKTIKGNRGQYPDKASRYMPLLKNILTVKKNEDNKTASILRKNGINNYYGKEEKEIILIDEDYEKLKYTLELNTNNIPVAKSFQYLYVYTYKDNLLEQMVKYFDAMLHIDHDVYNGLSVVRPWLFPADLTWKVTNPGEQATSTFNKIILEDTSLWFKGGINFIK